MKKMGAPADVAINEEGEDVLVGESCACGHVEDEHGHDPDYPGSSSCRIDDCECVAYDEGQ